MGSLVGVPVSFYIGATSVALINLLLLVAVYPGYKNKPILLAFLAVFVSLHAISYANAYIAVLPGAQWDAASFHAEAGELAAANMWPELSVGSHLYEYILVSLYRLFGSSLFLGQMLSIVAATLSLIVVSVVAGRLGLVDIRLRAALVLVVGLYPTFLYHNALSFREPFETLGLALGVLCSVKAMENQETKRLMWIMLSALCFVLMGLFHQILLVVSVILIGVLASVVVISGCGGLGKYRQAVCYTSAGATAMIIVAGGYFILNEMPVSEGNDYMKKVRKADGLKSAIVKYREEIERENPRTSFNVVIDDSDNNRFLQDIAVNYINYLGRPTSKDVESSADVIPLLATWGRILLIITIIALVMRHGARDVKIVYSFGVYFIVTAAWSVGTTNYGQAFRHHSMTDWLLILATCLLIQRGIDISNRLTRQ